MCDPKTWALVRPLSLSLTRLGTMRKKNFKNPIQLSIIRMCCVSFGLMDASELYLQWQWVLVLDATLSRRIHSLTLTAHIQKIKRINFQFSVHVLWPTKRFPSIKSEHFKLSEKLNKSAGRVRCDNIFDAVLPFHKLPATPIVVEACSQQKSPSICRRSTSIRLKAKRALSDLDFPVSEIARRRTVCERSNGDAQSFTANNSATETNFLRPL